MFSQTKKIPRISDLEILFRSRETIRVGYAFFFKGNWNMFWVVPPPSNSGKWRFRLGSPTKNVTILVVTVTGQGDNQKILVLRVSKVDGHFHMNGCFPGCRVSSWWIIQFRMDDRCSIFFWWFCPASGWNCWLGARWFWIPGIPEHERDCYLGVPLESQTNSWPLVESPLFITNIHHEYPPWLNHYCSWKKLPCRH